MLPSSLDDFLPNVLTQDTRQRLQAYTDLLPYLGDPTSRLDCEEFDKFIEGLASWVSGSNYKISLNGLEILCLMVDRLGENFKPHVTTVLPSAVDRLGDSKDQVRDQAQILLLKLMMPASSPQYVFERMANGFSHKLWRVREGVLLCLQKSINRYGARCLQLSKVVPSIIKLLEDQNSQVRAVAVDTLVEIYRHIGERVRTDLTKKGVPDKHLRQIFSRFDEVKSTGNMVPTADIAPSRDEPDFAKPASTKVPQSKRVTKSSTVGVGRTLTKASATPIAAIKRRRSFTAGSTASASSSAGGVDEDLFIKSFEDVPKITIYSPKDIQDHMTKIKDVLSDTNTDWEKRVENLKMVRSLMIQGAVDYDEFYQMLRILEPAFIISTKDLRSQVVRESCITMAYLSQQLCQRFDHFAECLLPTIINLIPNGAKVMASSAIVVIRFIIQYTHAARLVPILTSNLSAKASIIRRYSAEFLNQLLHTWSTHTLEKHIAILQEAIKKGINDADSDARVYSRKAFWGFADHFRDQADALLNNLDPAKQKMLQGELSNSSSSNSLNSMDTLRPPQHRARSASQDRTFDSSTLGRGKKTGPSRISSARSDTGGDLDVDFQLDTPPSDLYKTDSKGGIIRSNSAADLSCNIRRRSSTSNGGSSCTSPNIRSGSYSDLSVTTKQRLTSTKMAQTANSAHNRTGSYTDLNGSLRPRTPSKLQGTMQMHIGSYSSLPRQKTSSTSSSKSSRSNLVTADRSRTKSKVGTSQSQPNSRSSSPSSRLKYLTNNVQSRTDSGQSSRRVGGIPRSQGASRDNSPSRTSYGRERRLSGGQVRSTSKAGPAVMAQRVLKSGSDVEEALADALIRNPARKRYESYDSDDNASETSSVCSERSYSSFSRTSEGGSDIERRLRRFSPYKKRAESSKLPKPITDRRSSTEDNEDVQEILQLLSSGSYQERKEGLLSLQHVLRCNKYLSRAELKKVTEIFTRMFHDPHSKVFSMFLDTLDDLIIAHRKDLHEWLYTLLTRLLSKGGTDMLTSVEKKLQKALDTVRTSFSPDYQFGLFTRFIIDQTQSPNLKVKICMLNYLHSLVIMMDPTDFGNSSDTRLVVSRIITWTTEPKSLEIRKISQSVLIALFNLNPPEFSMMLSVLPKAFQDGATRILHNHLGNATNGSTSDVLSPRNDGSPSTRIRPPSRTHYHRPDEHETENMNPEEIYDSIKKTSADIQSLNFNSKLDHYEESKRKGEFTSQDSGIQDLRNDSPDGVDGKKSLYNPSHYQDDGTQNNYHKSSLAEAVLNVETDLLFEAVDNENEMIAEILTELSNHNERDQEREKAMLSLIKISRGNTFTLWDQHFKSILLILIETLGDQNSDIRALALRVLREILKHQPHRIQEYAELTALRILEAHKDPVREVARSAEECAASFATSIPTPQSIRILAEICRTNEPPISNAALKMLNSIAELMNKDDLAELVPDIIPTLIAKFSHTDSRVRKASCFCLVTLILTLGDDVKAQLKALSFGQMKLLDVYIKRAQNGKDFVSA